VIERLYRVQEAAEILCCSKWTIYKWLSEGKLQRTCIGGGRVVVRESEIQRLLQDGQRSTRGRKSQ
jgi:excisionase family DNA binding protein